MTESAQSGNFVHQLRMELPLIVTFQISGLFFIIFYYPEVALETLDSFAPTHALHETVDAILLWVYEKTDALQRLLSEQYHNLILAATTGVTAIFTLIALTTLRRGDLGVMLRAILFPAIGLLAIPTVLLAYVLRWIPGAILSILESIFGVIASAFVIVAPFVGMAIGAAVIILISGTVLFLLVRSIGGRIVLIIGIIIGGSLVLLPNLLITLTAAVSIVWNFASDIAAYPIAGFGYVFGFVVAVLAFIVGVAIVLVPSMFVVSQFGHILMDSLFDARNVRRSSRAAGRFLVGIGFLASTILLCLPGNQLAQHGAAQAYAVASQFFGGNVSHPQALAFVADLGTAYLVFVPNPVEPAIVRAFSYGYPPSLELILVTIACAIAFVLIAMQLFRTGKEERLGIAFFPRELVFLLIGAVHVVLFAMAAAGDAEE